MDDAVDLACGYAPGALRITRLDAGCVIAIPALASRDMRNAKEAVEEELRTSNARLETLLKEVNHRVANSLQLISAFVHMQSSVLHDPAAQTALLETEQRIQAIAQVHRRLYTSGDMEFVAMDEYLGALIPELEQSWSTPKSPHRLLLNAEKIRLKSDRAVSLGVIVNELVSNACKYAYPRDQAGEVRICLQRSGDGSFVLEVEDDGQGLPEDGHVQGTGLDTKLVCAMATSLQGKLTLSSTRPGCRAEVVAPE